MKPRILHILNGDATLRKFQEVSISGAVMVWNETLAIGPLFYLLDSELFWEMRSQFMEKAYGAKLSGYRRKVISQFQKLKKFQGDTIVLWYEYDVFCQVNFIALMSYILRNKKNSKVEIVCVGDHSAYEKRVGLGQLPSAEYPALYEHRRSLEREDLLIADKAWMYWCGKLVERFSEIKSDALPYLSDALEASKVLFSEAGSVSPLKLKIRSMLQSGKLNKREMIRDLLNNDETLGFGDLQYEYLIHDVGEV